VPPRLRTTVFRRTHLHLLHFFLKLQQQRGGRVGLLLGDLQAGANAVELLLQLPDASFVVLVLAGFRVGVMGDVPQVFDLRSRKPID